MYGVNEQNQLYVHVKIFKQGRIFGEVLYTGGVASIRCRNCLRWNKVVFVDRSAKLEVTDPPVGAEEK